MSHDELVRAAYHEAGHAAAAYVLTPPVRSARLYLRRWRRHEQGYVEFGDGQAVAYSDVAHTGNYSVVILAGAVADALRTREPTDCGLSEIRSLAARVGLQLRWYGLSLSEGASRDHRAAATALERRVAGIRAIVRESVSIADPPEVEKMTLCEIAHYAGLAESLLRARWASVDAFADALLTKRRLTGPQAMAILAGQSRASTRRHCEGTP